jgi:uncharacterized protein YqeY
MLRETLTSEMKDAMRNKEKCRLGTIRLILAALKDRDISVRTDSDAKEMTDDDVIEILSKMVKQRKESIVAYEEAGRAELAEQEKEEMAVIYEFLPKQMDEGEIDVAVKSAIEELGATGLKDIGKIMGVLKAKYGATMDFSKASALTKNLLS